MSSNGRLIVADPNCQPWAVSVSATGAAGGRSMWRASGSPTSLAVGGTSAVSVTFDWFASSSTRTTGVLPLKSAGRKGVELHPLVSPVASRTRAARPVRDR